MSDGSRRKIIALSALTGMLMLGGCHSRPFVQGANTEAPKTVTATLPLDRIFVLEVSGAPASDTTVSFRPGTLRTIVLRHAPPDNTVFAELIFAKEAFPDSTLDSVRVTLKVKPGVYGLTISSTPSFSAGTILRFKYPVHFTAPAAAIARYGNDALFEQALAIGVRQPDSLYTLLPSTRPAADNLEAVIPGPGVYLIAAPR